VVEPLAVYGADPWGEDASSEATDDHTSGVDALTTHMAVASSVQPVIMMRAFGDTQANCAPSGGG
jgi:hypothetical protein